MFVGSVGWFVELTSDLDHCCVRLFDCNSEEIVWNSDEHNECDTIRELSYSEFADYEVLGYDLYLHDGRIYFEINIEVEEDD